MRLCEIERIEHGGDVGDSSIENVGGRIVRLVAPAETARVGQDQTKASRRERTDIAALVPILDRLDHAVLKDERRAFPFDALMDANSLVVSVRHRFKSPISS